MAKCRAALGISHGLLLQNSTGCTSFLASKTACCGTRDAQGGM